MHSPLPRAIAFVLVLLAVAPGRAANRTDHGNGAGTTAIRVIIGDERLRGTLNDTPAGRDFASLLPLDLTLTDYHGTEKIANLPRTLDTRGAPDSYAPSAGDITIYAPWGNLAIFYKPFPATPGLVPLGKFDGPIHALLNDRPFTIRIERAD